MSDPRLRREAPMYDVVVEAHELVARKLNGEPSGHSYSIERLAYRTGGTASLARLRAVHEAHRRAGVPAWRPYVRESWAHARVTRYMVELV